MGLVGGGRRRVAAWEARGSESSIKHHASSIKWLRVRRAAPSVASASDQYPGGKLARTKSRTKRGERLMLRAASSPLRHRPPRST